MFHSQKSILFIITLLYFGISNISAKDETKIISGKVIDTANVPIAGVSIVFKNNTDETLAFGITNSTGVFSITFSPPTSDLTVTVSCMGYQSMEKIIKVDSLKQVPLLFVLIEQEEELQGVVITNDKPITITKDTITFKADSFRLGNERKLSDLLLNIPGFQIEESGVIKFQGKAIEKILIEGDDITGRNYEVISKNLNAEYVDKLQIINGYVDNKLQKGFIKDDKIALNLSLKRNGIWFGDIELNLGSPKKFDADFNLLHVTTKFKTINFASANNIGSNPFIGSQYSQVLSKAGNLTPFNPFDKQQHSLYCLKPLSAFSDERRQNLNNAKFLSVNSLLRPSKESSLRTTAYLYTDNIRQHSFNNQNFNLTGTDLIINETNNFGKQPFSASVELEYRNFYGNTKSLNAVLNSTYLKDVTQSATVSNTLSLHQTLDYRPLQNNLSLTFLNRLSDTRLDKIDIAINYLYGVENATIMPLSFSLEAHDITKGNSLIQYIPTHQVYAYTQYERTIKKGASTLKPYFNISGVFSLQRTTLQMAKNGSIYYPYVNKDFSNNSTLIGFNNQVGTDWQMQKGKMNWFTGIASNLIYSKARNYTIYPSSNFYWSPLIKVGFKFNVNKNSNVTFILNHEKKIGGLADISNGFFFTGYRSIQNTLINNPLPYSSSAASLNYSVFDPSKGITLNLFWLISRNTRNIFQLNTITDSIIYARLIDKKNIFTNTTLFYNASKFISTLKVNIKAEGNYNHYTVTDSISSLNLLRTTYINSANIKLGIKSVFKNQFNFEVYGSVYPNWNKSKYGSVASKNFNLNYRSYFGATLKISKQFFINSTNINYWIRNSKKGFTRVSFVDLQSIYTFTKVKFFLSAQNILDKQSIGFYEANEIFESRNSIGLQPRIILLGASFGL